MMIATIHRRVFLETVGMGLAASALSVPGRVFGKDAAAVRRPNILFICTDDQRHDALSVVQREQGERGRFPWLRTPHMDRLAAEGVRFRNAFVVNSLCSPSRAVFLTGRYSHLNGVASNVRPFPVTNVTYATLLRGAGYTTGYIGKWHMGRQMERPGFDFHASYIEHGDYTNSAFIVDGRRTLSKGWVDDVATEYAIRFLQKQKGSDRPWMLAIGFKSPHAPCEPPERAKDRYRGELARRVPNLASPPPFRSDERKHPAGAGDNSGGKVPVKMNYFRCISAMDDCVGRLLGTLDTLGLARNTIVIFTSDNGYYLGEHELGDKRSAYDESLRIPLVVRYPALGEAARGRVVDEMVLNLDLAQTILDFAHVPAPQEMQGMSWRPLMEGRSVEWRKSWFYEYFAEKYGGAAPDITAVRTADAKLIKYVGHEEGTELFDLKADPYEIKNLFRDPAQTALRGRMEAEHERLMKAVGYCVPAYVDRPEGWGKAGGPGSLSPAKREGGKR